MSGGLNTQLSSVRLGTCSTSASTAVSRLEQQLGGHWFLVQCGEYGPQHPYAGQVAWALLQLCLVEVTAAPAGTFSPDRLGQERVLVRVLQAPQESAAAVLVVLAYQVDQQLRLTGEQASTHSPVLPRIARFKVYCSGAPVRRLSTTLA
jgi:hypothetical protein